MAEATAPHPRPARQPFTFGGVARYAYAGLPRLFAAALVFAVLGGAVISQSLHLTLGPGDCRVDCQAPRFQRHSRWQVGMAPAANVRLLVANAFVSFSVASRGTEENVPVDFAFQFEPDHLSVHSLLGFTSVPYPAGWTIGFNRTTLFPLWGAWEQALGPLCFLIAAIGLLVSWALLALPYAFVVRIFALALRKEAAFAQAWRLSVAAQWPGAVLLTFVLALYATGQTTFLLVCAAFVAHFLLTFVYLLFSPLALRPAGENPFASGKPSKSRDKNPFKSSGRGR